MSVLSTIRREVPAILALAVPIVAGLGASTLLGVTDSVMLAPLGPLPLAAVGITNAVAIILFAAIYGLLSAMAVRVGAAHGARQGRQIPALLRNGLVLGAIVGALGMVAMLAAWPLLPLLGQPPEVLAIMFPYWVSIAVLMLPFSMLMVFKATFEAVDRPWVGTGFAFLAVGVNIPLNYALIWGVGPLPMLGLTGAGIASLAAESLALAAAWVFWVRARSMRRLRLRAALSGTVIASVAREGAPLGLMYVAETGAMAVATLMIGSFGALALAGNQVAMSVGGLLYMVPLGVAGAVAIRVAQERGAGNDAALRPIAWAALLLATAWLAASAAVLGLYGRTIAGWITDEPEVVTVAAALFFVFAFSQVMDGVQSTMTGALRGLSDTGFPAWLSLLAYWALGLPLGWVLAQSLGMGPAGVWTGFIIALGLAAVLLVWRFLQQTTPARLGLLAETAPGHGKDRDR
ncbi:MATE family efflux transporter [Roseateles sp.]|jgi:MATE family multidrug resistance protein|uniref:MATE family efflux transporter n=1 Tax=Roseateles sp. TaxID=1971397 RepID=UPI0037C666F4